MHSEKYEIVKKYYERKTWDINRVKKAVGIWITKEEYFEITGEDYVN